MQRPGGITYHQAPALGAPELKAFSSIVPQEMLGRVAEAEEGERRLGEDRDGDDQHRVGEDQRQRVGEDVGADDVACRWRRAPGRARRTRARAGSAPGRGRSARCPAHEVSPITTIRTVSDGLSRRARTIISGSVGITRNQFSSGVEDAVGPAAEVAAGEADGRAEHGRDQRRGEADDDRDAGADEELREDVGAVLGRAEDVAPARRLRGRRGWRRSGRRARAGCRRSRRRRQRQHAEPEAAAPGPEQQRRRRWRRLRRGAAAAARRRDRPSLIATAPAGRGRSRGSRRAGWRGSRRRRRPGRSPAAPGSPCR